VFAEERGEQASRGLTSDVPPIGMGPEWPSPAPHADEGRYADQSRSQPDRARGRETLPRADQAAPASLGPAAVGVSQVPWGTRVRQGLDQVPESDTLSMLQLAHELRSPLASIQSALDMLLQGYAANDPQLHDEMLGLARDRAVMMLGQVNDFLRLGAVQLSEVERQVRPVQLLDVLKRLAPEKQVRAKWRAVEFDLDLPESLPMVDATPEDMEHLLSNLINNAIKYNVPGGSVVVSLKTEGDSVVGVVKDTGIGIAREEIPRIFEEFYRTETAKDMDAHGTGLGLSIVKRIVDLYGGQLYVESKVGEGSQFSFAFPQALQSPADEVAVDEQLAWGGVRVPIRVPAEADESPWRERSVVPTGRQHQRIKVFRDLQREVVAAGLCGKCGGCVSFCSAGALNALEMGDEGLPRYADRKKCMACGICYVICPVTRELDAEMRETFGWRSPIGVYRAVRSARAVDESLRAIATDGGVVTALLSYLLERRLIDGAIVSQKTTAFSRIPLIATTREELYTAAGSHFGGSSHLEELGDRYTTYSPTLSAVKGLEGKHLQRVAMVGTPCQVRSIKKMQCLGVLPAHVIIYTIGLFCMEAFSLDTSGRRRIEERLREHLATEPTDGRRRPDAGRQVLFDDIAKLNIKEDMIISLDDGRIVHIPFDEVEDVARPACLACTDFASDYADLSAGGLGSPNGYTTILIRTPKGSRVYSEALRQGYIEERQFADRTEARGKEAEMVDKVVDFAQRKRMRGEARRRELVPTGGESVL
jgi:coenzyme F420 hydrogenase subunit beta